MIDLTGIKKLVIGGVELKKLAVNGVEVWSSYTNWVPLSINADGTIYNGTGYKNGYRIRSGGAEATFGSASCTGFIPVKGGDVVRLSGYDVEAAYNANAINVSDASFTNLGQITPSYADAGYGIFASDAAFVNHCWKNSVSQETDSVWKWTVPEGAGIEYIRVSGYTGGNGANMIVTVNEEIA